ncbi:leucine-rich repeat-containing protein 42 isoform X2 [Festucalex cinctus]
MDDNDEYVRVRRIVFKPVVASSSLSSSCRRTNPLVLHNVHHVDSLVGFPEQIGNRLFTAAAENRVFLKPDVSPKALRLFSDAYGDMVLGSLCLRNRFPLLSERMADIKSFHSLKRLDLFGCRLGDDHEIFQHLTSASLASCLIQLLIGGNGLSDDGLRRLTAPVRMKRKGLDCLQCLDVSHNPVSERALRYLKCLPKLEKLDASRTSMKFGSRLKSSMWELLGLIYSERALDDFDHSGCKTHGWAEQVVNQWETNGAQLPKLKKLDESRISVLRFFGRQKFVREVLNAAPLSHGGDATAEQEQQRLHFYKPPAGNTTGVTSSDRTCWNSHGKRKQPLEKCSDHLATSPPMKRASSSALTADDMDLLDLY